MLKTITVWLLNFFLFTTAFASSNADEPNAHFRHCNKKVFLERLEITNTSLLREKTLEISFSSASTRMSSENTFTSLEDCLAKHIPAEELKEVKRVIFGRSDE